MLLHRCLNPVVEVVVNLNLAGEEKKTRTILHGLADAHDKPVLCILVLYVECAEVRLNIKRHKKMKDSIENRGLDLEAKMRELDLKAEKKSEFKSELDTLNEMLEKVGAELLTVKGNVVL